MKKPTHEVEVDVLPTMRKMASVIREELQDMELDDHTQLAAAAILVKFGISLYRGTISKEEIAEVLQHTISNLDEVEVINPTKRTTH